MNVRAKLNGVNSARWAIAALVLSGATLVGLHALAAGGGAPDTAPGNVPYDGRFIFVRLRYDMSLRGLGGGFIFGGDLPWAHDYPTAERHFMRILDDLTLARVFLGDTGGNILSLDDPELHRFPLAYMSEPGYWTMSDTEAEGLRAYLQKGGFLIFDDFRGEHWNNLEAQMQRVLPGAQWHELDVTHPVFHSFFDIKSLEMDEMYPGHTPEFLGIYEDNDPTRRLMVVANYNNDIGEYWEWDGTAWLPVDLTNEAYKFGVNYVMYALTH